MRATGLEAFGCGEDEDPIERAAVLEADIILYELGGRRAPSELEAMLETHAKGGSSPSLILLTRMDDAARLTALFNLPNCWHLVGISDRGKVPTNLLMTTVRKIVERDIFGIEKYLRWGSAVRYRSVCGTAEGLAALEHVDHFLRDLQCRTRLICNALTVAEEFLLNAIYDAPYDPIAGVRRHAHQSRQQSVTLAPHEAATLSFGSDGERIAIACRDPFGSLDPADVMRSLARGFRKGSDQIRLGDGGAGIGLYMAFNFVNHLAVNVKTGSSTEFIGVMDIFPRQRKGAPPGRSLNLFVDSSDRAADAGP